MSNCDTCVVRNRAICAGLDQSEVTALNQLGRRQTLARGQTILWEGDEALVVANVIDGVLKLSTTLGDGREQIVGIVYPSDFIGRPFGQKSHHNVTALTDAKVCVFPRKSFDNFAREHPELEHKLLQRTLTELDRARHWMLLLGRKTASEKIATFLLEMADRLAPRTCDHVADTENTAFDLPFGRQQIADILGLTIETVSRQLTAMKQDGVIEIPDRRRIVIADRQALELLTGNTD